MTRLQPIVLRATIRYLTRGEGAAQQTPLASPLRGNYWQDGAGTTCLVEWDDPPLLHPAQSTDCLITLPLGAVSLTRRPLRGDPVSVCLVPACPVLVGTILET